MGDSTRFSDQQQAEIVRRYQDGEGVKPLSRAFDTSQHQVRKVLANHNVALRTQSETARIVQAQHKINDGLTGNQRRLRRQRKAGLCSWCRNPHLPGLALCATCRDKSSEAEHRYRRRRRQQGLCPNCNRPSAPNRKLCQGCLARDRALRKQRKSGGLCVGCGISNPDSSLCPSCLAQRARCDLRLKVLVFNAYGGCRCACCGEANMALLTLDHVAGDGAAHRRALGKRGIGRSLRRELRSQDYPPGYQVLCAGCNFAKRTGAECPHQEEWRQMIRSLAGVSLTY